MKAPRTTPKRPALRAELSLRFARISCPKRRREPCQRNSLGEWHTQPVCLSRGELPLPEEHVQARNDEIKSRTRERNGRTEKTFTRHRGRCDEDILRISFCVLLFFFFFLIKLSTRLSTNDDYLSQQRERYLIARWARWKRRERCTCLFI